MDRENRELGARTMGVWREEGNRSKGNPNLQKYWRVGTGNNYTSAQLQNPVFQDKHYWSAAFISWVMRTANAHAAFSYSQRHTDYTRAARDNRRDNNSNPFKAYRITELAPEAGDLVCKGRPDKPATYDDLRKGMTMHCDIVTKVQPGSIVTVGGNVGGSVKQRKVRTDPSGLITAPDYFAVIRISDRPPVTKLPVMCGTLLPVIR